VVDNRAGRWRALLVAIGVAAALVVVWWWWTTTSSITGLGDAVTEAGRLAGMTSGLSVIALVTLIARIGPLDRALGTAGLRTWHERLGRYAVIAILAHGVLITTGYALTARVSVGAQLLTFLAEPTVLLAVVAAVLLVAVGVASIIAVRRKLPYEVWHVIHGATYAAILLGLLHQVTQGAQLAGQLAVSAVWVTACLLPVAALVVNRLLRPLSLNARQRFTLARVVPEAPGVFSLIITGAALDEIPAAAGQFVRMHANARGLRFSSNPYSLSAMPRGAGWRVTVDVVGEHSRRLTALPAGTRLWLEGPMGGLILDEHSTAPVLLVAGGSGVAPIRALAEAALVQRPQSPVVVFYRAKDASTALFRSEWADLTAWANGRLAVYLRTGSRRVSRNKVNAATLSAVAPWIGQADVLACGVPALTDAVEVAARQAGAASVRVESFTWAA